MRINSLWVFFSQIRRPGDGNNRSRAAFKPEILSFSDFVGNKMQNFFQRFFEQNAPGNDSFILLGMAT